MTVSKASASTSSNWRSDRSSSAAPCGRRAVGLARLAALTMLSVVLALGCGNDGESGSSGTNGNGAGATNGGGATGGDGVAPFSGAALCSLIFGADGNTGFVRLVSDAELEAGEPIDSTAGAIEVGGGVSCAVQDRSVFALNWESPTITRYDEEDGALVKGLTVSFANFGPTSLASDSRQTVLLSETKAYFLDVSSSQIIVWNPSAMETIGAIPLTVAEPPEGLTQNALRVNLIDGLLVAYNGYRNEQDILAGRTDFWWIDPETDEIVATDVTEQCGNLQPIVSTTTNGDTYIGMSGVMAMEHALGLPGSVPPCGIRIRAGALEVDPTYLADFNALTGGLPTSGPIPAGNDRGLLLAYDTSNVPIDPMLTARELAQVPSWNFYEWELGTEQPATLVESIPTGTGRADTREFEGKTFLVQFTPGFGATELFDLTRRPVETTLTLTNVTVVLARLGSEPDARMAQRFPTRVEGRNHWDLVPFRESAR